MRYHAPEDILPGTEPDKVASGFAIMITTFVAGAGMGFLWAALNAQRLGCRDLRRQWTVLGSGWLVLVCLAITSTSLTADFPSDALPHLLGEIVGSFSFLVTLGVYIFIDDRQTVLFRLHERSGSNTLRSIMTGLGITALSMFVGLFLASDPVFRAMWFAGSFWVW